jgi:hypothetical protein
MGGLKSYKAVTIWLHVITKKSDPGGPNLIQAAPAGVLSCACPSTQARPCICIAPTIGGGLWHLNREDGALPVFYRLGACGLVTASACPSAEVSPATCIPPPLGVGLRLGEEDALPFCAGGLMSFRTPGYRRGRLWDRGALGAPPWDIFILPYSVRFVKNFFRFFQIFFGAGFLGLSRPKGRRRPCRPQKPASRPAPPWRPP